ncbi:alpha/beta fold hydrolase [Halobacterium sp. KA-6]|uniref:alpha/beta fold hydrolase n=1 Tax=Halobacterium sp. KA-6 TaxID=2896368 RepID=UPI001E443F73|nr:alpha/beta hydrolase [Halobacterium sp. KA-6]MCD2205057.1 alpha/beta hydrolase [Halobacterium sp. KA-6]
MGVGTSEKIDAELLAEPTAESVYWEVNNVELHVVTAGNEGDPVVVFLHGFPEFWYSWREHVQPFVDAGYRVLIPDQRGYYLSETPSGTDAYRISLLSGDIAELLENTGAEPAHVVGHDWGASVAWDLSLRHPDVVDRLAILNVPHPTVFVETLTSSVQQMRKSWYMFFFQLPWIPEWYMRRNDYAFPTAALRGAQAGTFSETDLRRYRAAWDRGNSLTGMINWYRALFRHREDPPRETVSAPTLVCWGERDQFLLTEMAAKSLDYCDQGRLERFPDATHWIHHEQPARVTEVLLDHFQA